MFSFDRDEEISKADIDKKLRQAEERREQMESEKIEKLKDEHSKVCGLFSLPM